MKLSEFSRRIFQGESIEDKLIDEKITLFDHQNHPESFYLKPGRKKEISFSEERIKFPKGKRLLSNEGKAIALHSFANHELLAIEIMAMILLRIPAESPEDILFQKGILKTLSDEQKHFKMYVNRLHDLGYQFGDFPVSDFFWRWAKDIRTFNEYLSMMSLTFEGANLDFAHYFEVFFREHGDFKTADILKEVYTDEISHVAFGARYLNKWRKDKILWEYYLETLIFPMTPARAKGIHFYKQSRLDAGLDESFIDELFHYQDQFLVTKRKTWDK